MMLESFRLPGESQQIERILQAFSRHYYISSKGKKYLIIYIKFNIKK